jgi:prevent-host-death family protein
MSRKLPGVGVRELRENLCLYLRRVKAGERVPITDRGKPVAVLTPPASAPADVRIEAMIRSGLISWGGGKPKGSPRPLRAKGKPMSQVVIEGRR